MASGKSLSLSEPQFSHLPNGDKETSLQVVNLVRADVFMHFPHCVRVGNFDSSVCELQARTT